MAELLAVRVTTYRPPFHWTGVEFSGPLLVTWGRGTAKRWGCLFTRFATQAAHTEVAPSFETDDFILVFRQFMAHQDSPCEIIVQLGDKLPWSQSGAARGIKV